MIHEAFAGRAGKLHRVAPPHRRSGEAAPTRDDEPDGDDPGARFLLAQAEVTRLGRLTDRLTGDLERADRESGEAAKRANEARLELARRIIELDGSPLPHPDDWHGNPRPLWRATVGGRRFGLVATREDFPPGPGGGDRGGRGGTPGRREAPRPPARRPP